MIFMDNVTDRSVIRTKVCKRKDQSCNVKFSIHYLSKCLKSNNKLTELEVLQFFF